MSAGPCPSLHHPPPPQVCGPLAHIFCLTGEAMNVLIATVPALTTGFTVIVQCFIFKGFSLFLQKVWSYQLFRLHCMFLPALNCQCFWYAFLTVWNRRPEKNLKGKQRSGFSLKAFKDLSVFLKMMDLLITTAFTTKIWSSVPFVLAISLKIKTTCRVGSLM